MVKTKGQFYKARCAYLANVINKSRAKGLAFIVPKKSIGGFCKNR